ncbi:MAG: cytochrome b N-terminal domain-containing protein [Planctomycetes bacterium]|nr:cytochrome b N-terminal domain-containing protein [Planctomycetota bacterium]
MSSRLSNDSLLGAIWFTLRTPVRPGYQSWSAFGWQILGLLLMQGVSGILLALYYQPSPEMASQSVEYIMRDVNWGWLVRGVHHWTSVGILVLTFLQLLRVLVTGSYRGARAASWGIGLILMVLMLGFAFSGELLAWGQDAYWTVTMLLEHVESMPVLGPWFAALLRGGPDEVDAATLGRTFSWHVLLLPWLTFLLLVLHFWLMARRRPRSER